MTASILDDVVGMGPVRKKAVLRHFKSFKRLREASLQEIKDAHVVPDEVAQELYRVLSQYNDNRDNQEAAFQDFESDEVESMHSAEDTETQ